MSTDTNAPSLSEQKAALEAQLAALEDKERAEEAKAFAAKTTALHATVTKAAGQPLTAAVKSGDRQAITAATSELLNAARALLEHVAPVAARRVAGAPRQSSGSYGTGGLRGRLSEIFRDHPTTAYTNAELAALILNDQDKHPSTGHVNDVTNRLPMNFIEQGLVVWADTEGHVAQRQDGPTGTARFILNPAHVTPPAQPAEDSGKTE